MKVWCRQIRTVCVGCHTCEVLQCRIVWYYFCLCAGQVCVADCEVCSVLLPCGTAFGCVFGRLALITVRYGSSTVCGV